MPYLIVIDRHVRGYLVHSPRLEATQVCVHQLVGCDPGPTFGRALLFLSSPHSGTPGKLKLPAREGGQCCSLGGMHLPFASASIEEYVVALMPQCSSSGASPHANRLVPSPRCRAVVLGRAVAAKGKQDAVQSEHVDGSSLDVGIWESLMAHEQPLPACGLRSTQRH